MQRTLNESKGEKARGPVGWSEREKQILAYSGQEKKRERMAETNHYHKVYKGIKTLQRSSD